MRISACVIAKNEEKNIEKWLKSIKPSVDEMIVVDTGSTDRTIQIAKSYGAKVYPFIWQNDFSKAKNYALEQAKGDWIIFLDADEYFTSDGMVNAIKNIQRCQQSNVQGLICRIINIDEDNDNIEMSSFANLRIFRNLPNLRYRYEVHEELYNKTGTLDLCMLDHEIEIYHTGYSSHIIEDKLKRNLGILLTDIAKNGEQPRHYRYLLDCYHGLKEYDKAIKYAKLHILSKHSSIANESTVYLKMLYSMIESKVDKETIEAEMKNVIKLFPKQPIFYAQYASFLLSNKQYDQALDYLLKSVEINKNKIGSEADSFQGVISKIYCNIAEILQLKNNKEEAVGYFCQSLLSYKYNAAAFGHLYMLLYQYNEVEIIDILNRIYTRTKRDTEFIVKQLQDYPLNKIYIYYQNILKTEFQQIVPLNKQYSMIAVGKYQELYCDNVTDLKEEMKLLALSLIINNDAVKATQYKNSLPINYQKIVERIYDNKQCLAKNDLPVYKEFLQQILLLEQNQESFEQYLLCAYDFVVAEIVEIANSLVDYFLCQQAIPLYQYVLENPNGFDTNIILIKLGYCYYKQEIYEEAIQYFNQAIQNGCTDKELVQFEQWSKEKMNMNVVNKDISATVKNINNDQTLTSIIILTYNQLEYTKLCIESIRNYTKKGTYEMIVVDNHSTDDTVKWLKKQKDIKTIFNSENKGFPAGCNQGIAIASGSEILLLNNDTIVTKNWLTNLKTALYSDEKVGAVGPVTNSCSNYQSIAIEYKELDELQNFASEYNVSNEEKWEEKIKLVGFCMLIKRAVVDLVGNLDEVFTPGNFEDDDYSFRIITAGYQLLLCNDVFIHHFGSVSFKEKPQSYHELLEKNALKFKEKWGFDARSATCCRCEFINLIDVNKSNIKVLDVGCACGATLLRIKYLNRTAKLHGIEFCPESAAIANRFATVIDESIENPNMSYTEGMFDYIILGDVLERVCQPQQVLENIKKYLKPDGYIVASVSNIMHISVVKDLLQGIWTYKDSGILDKNHLRFFTLEAINKIFGQAGYLNVNYTAINTKISAEEQKLIEQLTSLDIVNDEKGLMTYQYLVKASNKPEEKDNQVSSTTAIQSNENQDIDQSLKFILRRIEHDLDVNENLGEVIDGIAEQKYTIIQIVETIRAVIYQKAKVVILISTELYRQDRINETLKLLVEVYKMYPADAEIVYTLAYILNLVQDTKTALHVLQNFKGEDENIKELINTIYVENK